MKAALRAPAALSAGEGQTGYRQELFQFRRKKAHYPGKKPEARAQHGLLHTGSSSFCAFPAGWQESGARLFPVWWELKNPYQRPLYKNSKKGQQEKSLSTFPLPPVKSNRQMLNLFCFGRFSLGFGAEFTVVKSQFQLPDAFKSLSCSNRIRHEF